jgi:hypothetical protein
MYIPAMTACEFVSIDKDKPKTDSPVRSGGSFKVEGRYESNLTVFIQEASDSIFLPRHAPGPPIGRARTV